MSTEPFPFLEGDATGSVALIIFSISDLLYIYSNCCPGIQPVVVSFCGFHLMRQNPESCLRDNDGLTNPDYFQRPVPLFQLGDTDMITARQTAKRFTPAHDVSGSCATIGAGEVHIEGFEFAFSFCAVERHQQGLSGADIAASSEAIHGFEVCHRETEARCQFVEALALLWLV